MLTFIIFFAVLSILVFVHEAGHFLAARKLGIKVEEFGFGFPPRFIGFQLVSGKKHVEKTEVESVEIEKIDVKIPGNEEIISETITEKIHKVDEIVPVKKWRIIWGNQDGNNKNEARDLNEARENNFQGGTVYSINWIPLGGFVRLKGQDVEDSGDEDSFIAKAVWKRAIVISAGVIMNFLLAFLLFTGGFMLGLPQVLEDLPAGAHAQNANIVIGQVLPDTPAAKAKLEPGDTLVSLDGQNFKTVEEVRTYIQAHAQQSLSVVVRRGADNVTVTATPEKLAVKDEVVGLGVGFYIVGTVSYPWYIAPVRAAQATIGMTVAIFEAFGQMFKNLVTQGRLGIDVSGPVGIAVLTGRAAAQGFVYLLQLTAVLSLNLGVINFLPFPALDGGRFLFLIIEKIRRRPVSRRIELIVHQIGFALLLALVVVVTYRDIANFSGKIFG